MILTEALDRWYSIGPLLLLNVIDHDHGGGDGCMKDDYVLMG